ncbi:MAG TPA: tyrosine-type recombinase/integrase [Brevefilum sp.]|nr:tyrosine-type recombinase/integrase [Brevefilum sp.]HPL69714.1 tyrosine-type recombinase/integrase [Brevefilum sp.]
MARKSGQNQGSVTKRKNGSYMVQLTADGNRLTKYFKTKKEANAWRIETLQKIQSGLFYAGPRLTLSEYFEEWLVARKDSIKLKTLYQYRQIIKQHINPVLGNIKINELQPAEIQALYNKKVESGIGVRTVGLIHSVLHCALNHALRLGIIFRNPSDAVYKPKAQKREMEVLDENQARMLLIAAKGKRHEALYKLAITTGLRKGEILGLKWGDLDWDTHQLNVQRQIQRVPQEGLAYSQPKTAAGRRMIILGSDTILALKDHQKRQWVEREFMRGKWKDHDLIFPSSIGTPLSQSNLSRDYKQLLHEANLPDIRFHDLRHTAASLMLKQGISVKVVQERLGHSDAAMTLNVYSHVIPGMQREAAEKMDEITAVIDISEMLAKVENQNGLQ